MLIHELQRSLHSKYLLSLNIYRFTKSEAFEEAYSLSNNDEKLQSKQFIDSLNQSGLTLWVKKILKKYDCHDQMSLLDLRDIAHDLGIINYTSASRQELIFLIKSVKSKVLVEQAK